MSARSALASAARSRVAIQSSGQKFGQELQRWVIQWLQRFL
jgi:hypothetical protein